MLGAKFSEEPGEATYYTLMFQGKPLFQFQGEEYYCPTLDTELYPTDGNGHLFWNVPNSDERLPVMNMNWCHLIQMLMRWQI